jgi:hypothetical protein
VSTAPIIVSYSELDTFRQCPLKHYLGYTLRYTKPSKEGSALDKGSRYHLVMEEHYRLVKAYQDEHNGKNPKPNSAEYDDLMEACKIECHKLVWDPIKGDYIDAVADLIWWMYEGHLSNYGLMDDWRIRAIEHQIITPLRDQNGRRSRYHLKAKLDLIVRDRTTGGLWVVDHKSGQNLPSQMELEIDDQFGLYTWAMREVGKPVIGSLHAANRTQRNKSEMTFDQRMALTYLNRDEVELHNLALDAYYVARAAHPPKSQERARYSSPDPRSCGWKCDFKEPHLIMRRGRNPGDVMREYGFKIDRTRH